MTNDLKLTVYAVAADGRDYGTECTMFPTMEERDTHIWQMIEPDDYEPKELPDGEFESYRDKFGGDWTKAMDDYMPDDLTFTTEQSTIDLATVSAVAAMIERNAALEAFRELVASLVTSPEGFAQDYPGVEPTKERMFAYRTAASKESDALGVDALELLIVEARSLAADTAPTPAAAKSDLAAALEALIDQVKSTGAWTDACNGEDENLLADVQQAQAALAAFAGKAVTA